MTSDLEFSGNDGFLNREVKFARRWLTTKGVMLQEEQRNPVDNELESFFSNCRDGKRPLADLELIKKKLAFLADCSSSPC